MGFHTGKQDQGYGFAFLFQHCGQIVGTKQQLVIAWRPLEQVGIGVEAMQAQLRRRGILIRGKCTGFDQDLVTIRGRPVETRHQDVQVDGQRIHCDQFVIECADEFCKPACRLSMIGQPRALRMEVTIGGS